MILFYLSRFSGSNADISYNSAWLGLWAFAEISVGLSVTGTFLLPKFLEAEGPKLRDVLGRPLTSLTRISGRQWKNLTASSQEEERVTLDTVTMIMGRHSSSRSDTITSSSLHHDHYEEEDIERQCIATATTQGGPYCMMTQIKYPKFKRLTRPGTYSQWF